LKKSKFWDLVGAFIEFSPVSRIFVWPTIKTNGKTQKHSSKHVSGGEPEPEEKECSLKKSKYQKILGSVWRLHGIFSSFQIFLAGQQLNLTKN
jgi:hypothetical protein